MMQPAASPSYLYRLNDHSRRCFIAAGLTTLLGNATRVSATDPSSWHQKFYVTLRAEDNLGYVATSDDGLDFSDKQPWAWDNGELVPMSSTQQHWLPHSDGLFLIYTRKDASNLNVPRWRSPLLTLL